MLVNLSLLTIAFGTFSTFVNFAMSTSALDFMQLYYVLVYPHIIDLYYSYTRHVSVYFSMKDLFELILILDNLSRDTCSYKLIN